MHDYDNIPMIDWSTEHAAAKAKAQILHQEPVVLQMPADFNIELDGHSYNCRLNENTVILHDCNGAATLHRLAAENHYASLHTIAIACMRSGSQVDIDTKSRRIIVHD